MPSKVTKESLKDKVEGNELDLSLSTLSKIPVREIASLSKVKCVDLSCNQLTNLPDNFSMQLSHLIRLDLSKNALMVLPENFGLMVSLQHLDLLGNKLTQLPVSFGDLRSLRWLDLKENELEPELNKIVGDCLDDKQCKACAQRVVGHMQSIQAILAQQQEKKVQKQRAKEMAREAARKENESKERELRKRQKQAEKEKRRIEYEAAQAAKRQAEIEEQQKRNEEMQSQPQANGIKKTYQRKGRSSACTCLLVLCTLFFILLAAGVGTYFMCEHNPAVPACVTFHESWEQARLEIVKRLQ